MRILLDTHALIWWLAGDEWLPRVARTAIGDESNPVFFSAASGWEIATKYRLGRLPGAAVLALESGPALTDQGFEELPF